MKLTTWILVVAALLVLGALGGLLFSSGPGEPRDLLESALRRFNGPEQDTEETLAELELALRAAEGGSDFELAADILIARGRVYRDIGAYGPAREDLERALERYRPGAVDIELELIAIAEETGELADGLARAKRITDRDAGQLEAWTHAGQILARISENRLVELQELCDANLSDDDTVRAVAYARRAAGMDSDNPLRVSQLAGLRSLFVPPDQQDSLRAQALVEQASEANARARDALVRSFAGQLDRDAVQSYLELLARSGRTQDAVDFGLAVVPQRPVNSSPVFMERLARVLIDAGRPRAAGMAIQQHFNRTIQVGQQFYLTWCEALYKAGNWKQLGWVANQMRMAGDEHYRSMAVFYMGIAHSRTNQVVPTIRALEIYTKRDPVEPFPGALALAWRTIGAAWRTQGELGKERAALYQATQLEPNADGEVWLRLYQIFEQTESEALSQAEDCLTRALCLLPKRTGELLPAWIDLGRRRLRSTGVDLDVLIAEQRKQGRTTPTAETGPYALWRFGEMHRDARESVAAAACARRLLVSYPGFLPAMDLLADSARDLGDWNTAAEIWIERLRKLGPDPATLRRLGRLPRGTLSSQQLIELMQLDPENTGRLEVARTLRAEGRPLEALAGLTVLPLEPLGEEGALLCGELLIEVGRDEEALAMLDTIRARAVDNPRVFELAIDAARSIGKEDRLLEIIAAAPPRAALGPAEVEGLVTRVDGMIAGGHVAPARALLDLLDGDPSTRTRGVLLRRAALAMLERNAALAADELDRAEAFDAKSSAALGRLIGVLESRVYNRVPVLVRALYDTSFQPTRVQAAVLAILDERYEEARRVIAEARRRDPREAVWPLLEASLEVLAGRTPDLSSWIDGAANSETLYTLRGGDRQRDPHGLYSRLLALESPDWRLWAVAELSKNKPTGPGSLWATYLCGRGLASAGFSPEAERTWRSLLRSWPTFAPAWASLERAKLERVKRYDHVEMVRLRADRRKSVGRRPGEEAEEQLAEAWSREIAGNLAGAVECARKSVELDPALAPAWFKLGQLSHRLADWDTAIDALRRAARLSDVETASPIADDFVTVLRRARAAVPDRISAESVRNDLSELADRLPDDPGIALALARAELDQDDLPPAVRVARAYDRLDRFLLKLEDAARSDAPGGSDSKDDSSAPLSRIRQPAVRPSLERLRPGATRAWKDFYQELEPARAEAFVRAEMEERPGSLELWHMLGETLVAQDRRGEATALYELVARMVPDGQTHRALASLYADSGVDLAKVESAIAAAVQLEGRKAPDVDLLFHLGRALTTAQPGDARGLQILASLWQQRDAAIGAITDADIGQLYGTTLVQRSDPADRQLASNLLREASAVIVNDRSRKNLVDALASLAAQIPARVR